MVVANATPAKQISVVIVEDHSLLRDGVIELLRAYDDIQVSGHATTVAEAMTRIAHLQPDLVLLDMRLGDDDGLDVARRLRAEGSTVAILVLSAHETPKDLRDALAAGANGYLLKTTSGASLATAIRRASAGETVIADEFVPKILDDMATGQSQAALTPRELQILELVARGLSNRAIGDELQISARTAQKHLENLFHKFGVHDRAQLVSQAHVRGVLGS